MTKEEYEKRIQQYQEDFRFCFATSNAIEGRKIVKEMQEFIRTYSNNLQ